MQQNKKLKINRFLIATLIISALLSLSILIIYQYNKYHQLEDRINSAYSSKNIESVTLYKLFSTFSEADYLFRMYSINFNKDDFDTYNLKLDTIRTVLDSLSSLPIQNNPIQKQNIANNNLAIEYLTIKKQVDHLVIYAKDSLMLLDQNSAQNRYKLQNSKDNDSIINNILSNNQSLTNDQDTVIKKKEGFFKRVFNTKSDTIVTNRSTVIEKTNQQNIILRENIEKLLSQNNNLNNNNIKKLQSKFEKLKSKEKELIASNFTLLFQLKNGIEKLRELEFNNYKKKQEADFLEYTENTKEIRKQVIAAVSLMVLMIILIISYQKQVSRYEQRLIKEKEYADQIAEEKTSVLANISHEIRTPINSLKGLINVIKNTNAKHEIDKEIIQSIEYDITVINSTINDILSLSKLESESLEIKNEQIDIHKLIDDIISLHTYQSKLKGLKLIYNNSIPEKTMINSNPFRIKQIISNLITNAIKYTEKGSINVYSQIENDSKLIIKVVDTGIGITKEQGDQIFRKYYVADSKSKAGFGLGLYISKILSEQLNSKLYFTSEIKVGTTFIFELPLKEVANKEVPKYSEHTINEIPNDVNIVFIDDSKINLFFIQQLFKDNKSIHFFMDPYKALEYIKTNGVNIVITDLNMPKLSGWDILEAIKSDSNMQKTKVFACTAEPLLLESKNSVYLFDGVINKPIQENELVFKIINS